MRLAPKAGELVITKRGTDNSLAISEIAGSRVTDVLAYVSRVTETPRSAKSSSDVVILSGKTSWCRFALRVSFHDSIAHLSLSVDASSDPPLTAVEPDVTTVRFPSLRPYSEPLVTYSLSTPVAGSSVYVGDKGMATSALYFANFTALGSYFNATQSDPTQGNFSYPNGAVQSTVGVSGSQFGYEPPSSASLLPLHQWLRVIDSYVALGSMPTGQSEAAQQYLAETDKIVSEIRQPSEPVAPWRSLASKEIGDLSNGQNWDSVGGNWYLKSYVSDTRVSPELISQLSVLVGLRDFRAHSKRVSSAANKMIARIDAGLPSFFDSACKTMTNSLGSGPSWADQSWYYVTNLISLLQSEQLGDMTARKDLLASAATAVKIARAVHYNFPLNITCSHQTAGTPQQDVAGGYAYLMLGLYHLTHRSMYLSEAQASVKRLLGSGFSLSYELHMTAYGAAAAQMLYNKFHWPLYRRVVDVTLANFFASVRLWDCTYGYCAKGKYHTYMGVNPLPWSDYIAMREQYESWLAFSAFLSASRNREPAIAPEIDLVRRFVAATPLTMQYSLPTRLPRDSETATPGGYSFVPRNQLTWDIPLEDLREGLTTSGTVGQEIYGAGGPLFFAASSK